MGRVLKTTHHQPPLWPGRPPLSSAQGGHSRAVRAEPLPGRRSSGELSIRCHSRQNPAAGAPGAAVMKGQGSPERGRMRARGEAGGLVGGMGTCWGAPRTQPPGDAVSSRKSCLGLVTPGPGLGDAHPCGPRPQHRTASLCAARPQARGPPCSAHQPALSPSMTVVAHLHGPWQLRSRP